MRLQIRIAAARRAHHDRDLSYSPGGLGVYGVGVAASFDRRYSAPSGARIARGRMQWHSISRVNGRVDKEMAARRRQDTSSG